ncbi:hypothetical protein BH23PAT1_BH23PAT1_0730 [soil metagenome]
MDMYKNATERRMAENQVIFRDKNEEVPKRLASLKKAAVAEGHNDLVQKVDQPLHFYCECSDEQCNQRIRMKPSKYSKLHKNKKQFVILPGHEVPKIERVVLSDKKWVIVEKHEVPHRTSDKPHPTPLDNSDN